MRSVYVISSLPGPVKIGISTRVQNRLSELASASAVPLKLEFAGECKAADRVEKRAHEMLSAMRTHGEWFAATTAAAIEAVMSAAAELGHEIRHATPAPPLRERGTQLRAARALLNWKQTDLAKASRVSEMSIKNIERGATDPRVSTMGALQLAFEKAGVLFLDPGDVRDGGAGVRLKGSKNR